MKKPKDVRKPFKLIWEEHLLIKKQMDNLLFQFETILYRSIKECASCGRQFLDWPQSDRTFCHPMCEEVGKSRKELDPKLLAELYEQGVFNRIGDKD
jgi:hypothetical protein